MRQENVSSDSDQREVYLADAYVLRSPTKTPVPTREMRLDDILEKMPVGRFHYRLLVICGLCFMADAMEVTLLSFLSICAGADWGLSQSQVASISSAVFVGVLVGNLFWGPVADRLGRRIAFLWSGAIIILFGVLTGFAVDYGMLLAARIVVGFGLGGSPIPFDLLSEFLPQSVRGQFLININYFWTIGSMFVAGVAWAILPVASWKVLAIVTSIPVGISLLWAIFTLPESPRWLLLKGRGEEAEEVVRQAAAYNGTELPPFKLKVEQRSEAEMSGSPIELFYWENLPITIPLWTLWICFGFCYYGIVLLISRVFEKESSGDDDSFQCDFKYTEIFGSAASEVGGVVICALTIDRWGRVYSQMSQYFAAGVAVLFVGFSMPDGWLTFFTILARMASLASTLSTWVATPELFPTRLRATGHSVSSSLARLGSFSVPFLISSDASLLTVSVVLCVVNIVAAIAVYFLPETKDKRMDSRAVSGEVDQSLTNLLLDTSSTSGDIVRNYSGDRKNSDGKLS